MSRYVDDNYQHPPRVVHHPLHPPRKGTPGEVIYLQLWQDWCARNPLEWRAIFETNGPVRQRAASVAASFMVWMGCNAGNSFTFVAERFAESNVFGNRENAYLAAWGSENARRLGINGGLRASECILAREHPWVHEHGVTRLDWSRVPDVTQEDNDILESMAVWWSSPAARVMRSIAVPLIEAEHARLRAAWYSTEIVEQAG